MLVVDVFFFSFHFYIYFLRVLGMLVCFVFVIIYVGNGSFVTWRWRILGVKVGNMTGKILVVSQ